MSKESEVRDDRGNLTGIDVTSDDGRKTERYGITSNPIQKLSGDYKGEKLSSTHNNSDGTSEPDDSCCYITSACLDSVGVPRDSLE
ncbi:MAG TPA: hypothetical protein VKE88_00480, partial [Candidatus Nanoarchaeia archaeon]|nr:hypothetical protein [Candidatus Nanoarchaeia archaeon]